MTEPPLLLTTQQVAQLLQLSVWWVRDHSAELGRIEGMRPHRYLRERVEEFVRERARPAAPSVAALRPAPRAVPSPQATSRPRPRRVPLLEPGRWAA